MIRSIALAALCLGLTACGPARLAGDVAIGAGQVALAGADLLI